MVKANVPQIANLLATPFEFINRRAQHPAVGHNLQWAIFKADVL
jgi:hypothetical protein